MTLDVNPPPGKAPFDMLTDFAMFGALSFETLAVASIFVLRRRHPKSKVAFPYRCPLYPLPPIVYVVAMSAVLINMFNTQRTESLVGVGFIVVGALFYATMLRRLPVR